jgi:hypothetical protein
MDNNGENDKTRVFHLSKEMFLYSMKRMVLRYGKKILKLAPRKKKKDDNALGLLVKSKPPLEKTVEEAVYWAREFLTEYEKRKNEGQISYKQIMKAVKEDT